MHIVITAGGVLVIIAFVFFLLGGIVNQVTGRDRRRRELKLQRALEAQMQREARAADRQLKKQIRRESRNQLLNQTLGAPTSLLTRIGILKHKESPWTALKKKNPRV